MVSSTFYDLKQIRRDLAGFLSDELGYRALLSELPSFPINPDLDTIENCKRRVSDDADVLVLVVGGRYGSIDDRTAMSVTNLEYVTARAKGIPVYVFVEGRILSILPVWAANQTGDFAAVVDTPQLFAFVQTIRDADKVWVFPFETAQDIATTLRMQFAHLSLQGLKLQRKLGGDGLPSYLREAAPKTLRIALEKPAAWEYRLFFQAWMDEVRCRTCGLRDHNARVAIGLSDYVSAETAKDWLLTRLHELRSLAETTTKIVNVEANAAFGEPRQPGDAEHIVWTAQKIGQVLDAALDWSHRVRRARVHQPFANAAMEMAGFVDDLIDEIARFPESKLEQVDEALLRSRGDGPARLSFTFTVGLSNLESFNEALDEAQIAYGL